MKIGENYKREKEETMDKRKVKWSKERKERWVTSRWGGKTQKKGCFEPNSNSLKRDDTTQITPIEQ